jgi:UDP-glucose:(heptosyl)LPS alpha-1,3-glucosyltransferase
MQELVRRGHDVDLLTMAGQAPVPGVTVRRLAVLTRPSLARLLSFALATRRAARARPYDVVQSHERCLGQDIYRAGEGTHRGYLEAMGRPGTRSPYHRAVMALERRIFGLRAAREIVAISAQGKSEIERLYGTPAARVSVVYNGVDLARFHPETRERVGPATRAALGLAPDAWVVLFVGSGFERKGLGPLVEAVARLGDARARLVVAGKGRIDAYRLAAARLGLAERVVWAGPREDVHHLYAAADAVALPARYEPFGNVHLEALASGIPVATSTAAGGAEVVREGKSGFVRQAQDVAGFADALEQLRLGSGNDSIEAARRSAEPFTYAKQVSALEVIYRRFARNT